MNKIEYTKMFKLEDTHFWFVGKRYFVDRLLSNYKQRIHKILDLGSGTGGMTKHLQKYGNVTGLENYEYAIKLAKKRGVNLKKRDINNFEVNENTFDLVTIFDVLYHQNIKNEGAILKQAYKALKKNGYLLITDSAFGFLKSEHDIVTQGKRRYSITEIRRLVENQGFKVVKASYIYFLLFPFVFVKRFILSKLFKKSTADVMPVSPVINSILLFAIKIESNLLRFVSFPIGSSVILLAAKK